MENIKLSEKLNIENLTKNLGAFQWLFLNIIGFVVVVVVAYFIFWAVFGYILEVNLDILTGIAIFFFIPGLIGLIGLYILWKGLLKIFIKDRSKWNLLTEPTIKKVVLWIMCFAHFTALLSFVGIAVYWMGIIILALAI